MHRSKDVETMIIAGHHISQQTSGQKEVEPLLTELDKLPSVLGFVSRIAKDNGYFSADNVEKILQPDIEPYIVRFKKVTTKALMSAWASLGKFQKMRL